MGLVEILWETHYDEKWRKWRNKNSHPSVASQASHLIRCVDFRKASTVSTTGGFFWLLTTLGCSKHRRYKEGDSMWEIFLRIEVKWATVDGRNPAPVDRRFIHVYPITYRQLIGFQPIGAGFIPPTLCTSLWLQFTSVGATHLLAAKGQFEKKSPVVICSLDTKALLTSSSTPVKAERAVQEGKR